MAGPWLWMVMKNCLFLFRLHIINISLLTPFNLIPHYGKHTQRFCKSRCRRVRTAYPAVHFSVKSGKPGLKEKVRGRGRPPGGPRGRGRRDAGEAGEHG